MLARSPFAAHTTHQHQHRSHRSHCSGGGKMRSFGSLEKVDLPPFLSLQNIPTTPGELGAGPEPQHPGLGFANPSLAGGLRHSSVTSPASRRRNPRPATAARSPRGSSARRRPSDRLSSSSSPPRFGASPRLTLLTAMKPLESMLMPLCLRKPVAGTAPVGEGKGCRHGGQASPQPWGGTSPPSPDTRLPPGKGSGAAPGAGSRRPTEPPLHHPPHPPARGPCRSRSHWCTAVTRPPPSSNA